MNEITQHQKMYDICKSVLLGEETEVNENTMFSNEKHFLMHSMIFKEYATHMYRLNRFRRSYIMNKSNPNGKMIRQILNAGGYRGDDIMKRYEKAYNNLVDIWQKEILFNLGIGFHFDGSRLIMRTREIDGPKFLEESTSEFDELEEKFNDWSKNRSVDREIFLLINNFQMQEIMTAFKIVIDDAQLISTKNRVGAYIVKSLTNDFGKNGSAIMKRFYKAINVLGDIWDEEIIANLTHIKRKEANKTMNEITQHQKMYDICKNVLLGEETSVKEQSEILRASDFRKYAAAMDTIVSMATNASFKSRLMKELTLSGKPGGTIISRYIKALDALNDIWEFEIVNTLSEDTQEEEDDLNEAINWDVIHSMYIKDVIDVSLAFAIGGTIVAYNVAKMLITNYIVNKKRSKEAANQAATLKSIIDKINRDKTASKLIAEIKEVPYSSSMSANDKTKRAGLVKQYRLRLKSLLNASEYALLNDIYNNTIRESVETPEETKENVDDISAIVATLKVGDNTNFGKVMEIGKDSITFKAKDLPKTRILFKQRKLGSKDYVLTKLTKM